MARNIGSHYTAHRVLGRGSAGTVWLGEGPEGPVAIKLLREDLAADPDLAERFAHERHALLGLEHPHIVGVRELLVPESQEGAAGENGEIALVMDLVRGPDLRTHLTRERRLAPAEAATIVAGVASGLAVAHAAGIVHRDVKPENILLDTSGEQPVALLTDFGVAKLIDEPRHGGRSGVVGTPDYMAPEIVEGLPPRAAVDIYALVTVLYELLSGFTPFGGGHPGAVLRRQVTEQVAPLPGLPDELWELIQQCLAKAPASRLRAAELASRLRETRPALAGLPPLDLGDPASDEERRPASGDPEYAGYGGHGENTAALATAAPTRAAVPLVRGAAPDSERVTHTRMRVPDADELAGGAHGTARAPRAPGQPRAGSARNTTAGARRRRRLAVTVAGAAVLAVVAGWLLFSGGDEGGGGDGRGPATEVTLVDAADVG
ncbi:serine/threonine-protein kinase [Streptomyces triticirhizae]|uniref:non-specific serine/threonine protein kinase n=1 Tax=Streptomyces triticirhizae TaxID=2483353 RepID=A0A3M2LS57_9ACTN|nr:serine/threonine-protein kinase [Streptomyces triticirhizae]RMI39916.1 serine/threonine protein kinase [Streptomyces triticirhizae]